MSEIASKIKSIPWQRVMFILLMALMVAGTESCGKTGNLSKKERKAQIEAAKKQNLLLIKEAELKASQLIEKAKEEAENIHVAIIKLKDEKKLLIARIKAIIETQSDLLTLAQQNDFIPTQEKQKITDSSKINVDEIVEKLL